MKLSGDNDDQQPKQNHSNNNNNWYISCVFFPFVSFKLHTVNPLCCVFVGLRFAQNEEVIFVFQVVHFFFFLFCNLNYTDDDKEAHFCAWVWIFSVFVVFPVRKNTYTFISMQFFFCRFPFIHIQSQSFVYFFLFMHTIHYLNVIYKCFISFAFTKHWIRCTFQFTLSKKILAFSFLEKIVLFLLFSVSLSHYHCCQILWYLKKILSCLHHIIFVLFGSENIAQYFL